MSVFALGFAACDDYDEALPQSNPQNPLMSVDGLSLEIGEGLSNPIDLNTMEEDSVLLITAAETPEMNAGTYITYDVEIASDQNYSWPERVVLTNGKISKTDLNTAFRAFYGRTPLAKTLYFRFIPYFTNGSSRVAFKKDLTMAQSSQSVTPIDLGIEVDEKYYVVTDLYGDWSNSLVELTNGEEDRYENPVFEAIVDLQGGDISFMGSSDVEKARTDTQNDPYYYAWGPSLENSNNLSGSLIYGSDAVGVNIPSAGKYVVSINMIEHTYTIEEFVPTIVMKGQTGDMRMTVAEGNKYWYVNYVAGGAGNGFSFNDEDTGADFGYAGTTFVSNVDGVAFAADGSNITVSKGGWYLFGVEKTVDAGGNASYTVNLFPAQIYVYGNCNGGTWGDDPAWLFTVPDDAESDFVSPELAGDGELRLCVHPLNADGSQWIGDWWRSEFIFYNGKISYRGTGDDQYPRVNATAGSKVYLNFTNGTAALR